MHREHNQEQNPANLVMSTTPSTNGENLFGSLDLPNRPETPSTPNESSSQPTLMNPVASPGSPRQPIVSSSPSRATRNSIGGISIPGSSSETPIGLSPNSRLQNSPGGGLGRSNSRASASIPIARTTSKASVVGGARQTAISELHAAEIETLQKIEQNQGSDDSPDLTLKSTIMHFVQKSKDQLGESSHELKNLTPVGRLVKSYRFNLFFTVLIVLNAAYIGVETDQEETNPGDFWFIAELVFLSLFSVELFLRLFGLKWLFWRDGWNIFDFCLVTVAIVDAFVLGLVQAQGDSGDNTMQVLTTFRVVRLLRLARIFRLLRFFKELWLIVSGVFASLRTLFWTWILIILIIYIFGILPLRC
jgi:hypothetical protein